MHKLRFLNFVLSDAVLQRRTPENVGPISENHLWVVTRNGNGATIGSLNTKTMKISPNHGSYGSNYLEALQYLIDQGRIKEIKYKSNELM